MSHTVQEVAARMRELCLAGQYEQAQNEFYHQDAESIEPEGAQGMATVKGLDAIIAKGLEWSAMVEAVHGGSITEPIICGNYFTWATSVDVDFKGRGRMTIEEISVYLVHDGKVVREQFFYEM